VFGEHQWIIASMPEQAQIDVWGDDPGAVASSSLAPRETARPVQGGWRLSGRFPFSSGCEHAQWAIIGARAPDEAGNQPTRYMLIPIQEIDILDDWHVLGLRGTGSRTLVLRDVFVPAHRTVLLGALMEGRTPGGAVHPEYSLLRRGVEMLAELSGARTVYDADPLQPILRDVMTIASHSVVQLHPAMVPSGRILLGLPQGIGET
jgi:3-hydroxy-9,10-secoandrosta-1,3,5(10)-triene-9,17-dione monooxygenase